MYITCGVTTVFIAALFERYTKFKFGFINSSGKLVDGAVPISFFLWFLVAFFGTLHILWTLLKDMAVYYITHDDPWGTKPKPSKFNSSLVPEDYENHNETTVAKLRNALGSVYATSDILATMQVISDSDKLEKMRELAKSSAIQAMEDKPRVMELLTQIEKEK